MMNSTEQTIEDRRAAQIQEGREYAAKRFGISIDQVVWHHSGNCYDRVVVNCKEAAEAVVAKVTGSVNGGCFHGMPLGGQIGEPDEKGHYDIKC